mmetsp:Transcript_23438/g.32713  ORF Transcript_23438/g.32713 Transcript_23438/m.32713 type:complete len:118 (+) Transcript_23438:1506-1859(+)
MIILVILNIELDIVDETFSACFCCVFSLKAMVELIRKTGAGRAKAAYETPPAEILRSSLTMARVCRESECKYARSDRVQVATFEDAKRGGKKRGGDGRIESASLVTSVALIFYPSEP